MEIPTLLVSRETAQKELTKRIEEGKEILNTNYITFDENTLQEIRDKRDIWDDYNIEYLQRIFSNTSIADEYAKNLGGVLRASAPLESKRLDFDRDMGKKIKRLESIIGRLPLIPKKTAEEEKREYKNPKDKNNFKKKEWNEKLWVKFILWIIGIVVTTLIGLAISAFFYRLGWLTDVSLPPPKPTDIPTIKKVAPTQKSPPR